VGLGKTIQTVSLLALLKQKGEVKKPHLVVVPATGLIEYFDILLNCFTALENWTREFTSWCPSLRITMYHGNAKEREALRKALLPKEDGSVSFDVLITTYNLCINKIDRNKFFKKFDFSYIVLGTKLFIQSFANKF
jgi:SNF2 family DNA or RNA helicase